MLNVRRLDGDPKYQAVSGSVRGGIYPTSKITPGKTVLICEGEFDCLLARQVVGDLVEAVTSGSAGTPANATTLTCLSTSPRILIAYDADATGDAAATSLMKLSKRAERIRPPKGMDLTDLHLRQGGLRQWLRSKLS